MQTHKSHLHLTLDDLFITFCLPWTNFVCSHLLLKSPKSIYCFYTFLYCFVQNKWQNIIVVKCERYLNQKHDTEMTEDRPNKQACRLKLNAKCNSCITWMRFHRFHVTGAISTSCRREAATICPAPLRCTLRPSSTPYTWPAAPSAPCFQ